MKQLLPTTDRNSSPPRLCLPQPILLLGGHGMLGRAWRNLLSGSDSQWQAPDAAAFDLLDNNRLKTIPDGSWRCIINCAAWTDVDAAEGQEAEARRLNADAVAELAHAARQCSALLIHYSTDYVFDGKSRQPYQSDAVRCPLNAYGRSKAGGEEAIEASGADAIIIRTSWLYAPWGKNFVETIAALAGQREVLRVVDDQRGRPTCCRHLAAATARLAAADTRGIYHITDGGECSWFEFAQEIVRLLGVPCKVEPCGSDEFPRPAPRPACSVLSLTATEAILGPMPPWRENLADTLKRLKEPEMCAYT